MFYGSWKILISNMNTDNTLINQFSYSNLRIFDIFAVLKGIKGEAWQIETARSFLTALKTKVIFYQPMQLGYIQSLFLINIILIIISLFIDKKDTKKSLIILLVYDIGAIGYAFGMLMLYVFAFGPYEGPILASFERYMQTYILSGILISIFEIYSFEFKFAGKFKYLLCLLWIIFVPINDYYKLAPCNEYSSWGDGLRPLMENIANNVTINDKVLIIENNVQTINHYIMGYYLMPITIDVVDDGYDVIAGDRFCMEISETQLQEKIKNSTGYNATITRFPGGSSNTVSRYNPGIMTILCNEVISRGYKYFDWNVSSGDAGGAKTSQDVYNNVINGLRKNRANVVLMHDFGGNTKTLNALADIIDYGLNNGYTFSNITESTPMVTHNVNN